MSSSTGTRRHHTPSADHVDPKVLRRVRALLAKAEATQFPDEAAAFTAKANKLMTEHAISQVLAQHDLDRDEVDTLVLAIDAPYAREKYHLLSAVASANRCRAVLGLHPDMVEQPEQAKALLNHKGEHAVLVGYRSDLEIVNLLYTSLLIQAVNTMLAYGSVADRTGTSRTKSFRHSFLLGFASTIGQRLREANAEAADEAEARHDADSSTTVALVPLLQRRADDAEAEMRKLFPHLRQMSASVSNRAGLSAGTAAGATADIGLRPVGGNHRSLNPSAPSG